jgi:hypothetical protein
MRPTITRTALFYCPIDRRLSQGGQSGQNDWLPHCDRRAGLSTLREESALGESGAIDRYLITDREQGLREIPRLVGDIHGRALDLGPVHIAFAGGTVQREHCPGFEIARLRPGCKRVPIGSVPDASRNLPVFDQFINVHLCRSARIYLVDVKPYFLR